MSSILGIDVSVAQGKINWDQVANSNLISFAFCKTSEGSSYKDTYFDINWQAIKNHGLVRGCYHFGRTQADPISQANFYCSVVGSVDVTDMLALDIELSTINGSQFTDWILTFCETVTKNLGKTPFIYTGGPFFNTTSGILDSTLSAKFAAYPLWFSGYVSNPTPFLPSPWKSTNYTIWQKSGNVAASGDSVLHVPGISGPVDKNIFNGSIDDLKHLVGNLNTGTNNIFTNTFNLTSDPT